MLDQERAQCASATTIGPPATPHEAVCSVALSQWSILPLFVELVSSQWVVLSRATCFELYDPEQGRSFLVSNRHVATGRHQDNDGVLDKDQRIPSAWRVYHHDATQLGSWQVVVYNLFSNDNEPLWLEHPVHGRAIDVVALPFQSSAPIRSWSFPWAPREPRLRYGVGSTVFALGFPVGHEPLRNGPFPVWTRGSIASEPDIPIDSLPMLLIDARTRQGQSGSPVIIHSSVNEATVFLDGSMATDGQEYGEWLGVYSGRTDRESDLGRVWKADAVREIVRAGQRPSRPWGEPLFTEADRSSALRPEGPAS